MNTSNSLRNIKADHIAIRVTNFEETLNWYKEKLGFQEEVIWTVEGLPGMKLAYLTLNNFRIEIIGGGDFQPTVKPPQDFGEALNIQGYGHICFEVEDIDAAFLELNKKGVPTFVPPQTYPLSNYWRRVGFVLDNNGNVIEFAEKLLRDKPSK